MGGTSNASYWSQRMKRMEDALKDRSYAYVENMERQFSIAQAELETQISAWYQRFADDNNITLADARRLLTSGELEEFRWSVREYTAYGRQNALDGAWMKQLESAGIRARISRLEALKLQIQQQAERLYSNQLELVDAAVRESYTGSYYRTAFEVQRGLGVGWGINALDERAVSKVLSRPWTADGQTFRDRCWTNKQALVNSVNTQLTQMIIRGDSPDEAIRAVSHQFEVSREKAGRLIMTEAAAISSAAQKDCYKELGVERFRVVASLDRSTCGLCGSMDGQVFKMSEYQVGVTAPPFHPWCRCCTAPYFEDMEGLGERWARNPDGTTEMVPAGMTFEEWQREFIQGNEESLTATSGDGTILITGARIIDPDSQQAQAFADLYYEEIRHFTTDVEKIALNIGKSKADIQKIKQYLFVDNSLYDEELGIWRRFDTDCAIAQSWQRLMIGKDIKPHDITLIEHELLEMQIKERNPGISHGEAHSMAQEVYNYSKESSKYYDSLKKH